MPDRWQRALIPPKLSCQGIDLRNPVNFVPEKFHTDDGVIRLRGKNLNDVAPHTELVADKIDIVSLVLDFHQLPQKVIPAFLHPWAQRNYHCAVINWIAQTINAGYASHNDYIAALGQR